MINFFHNNKIIFYLTNFFLIVLYIFPGSLPGLVFYGDKEIQPQITPDFILSSNHFFVFILISIIGFFTYAKSKKIKYLVIYLIFLSTILEIFHLIIPNRSFEWLDLFGNLFGVLVVIFIYNLINNHGVFKK
tara:strand:+ start:1795 stop:2190 length:396 start_codon:yes stop_codon:yes gene_type:complete